MSNGAMILVQTYYTTDGKDVILHRKIGSEKWEEIITPYKEVPYVINHYYTKEEVDNLSFDSSNKILTRLTVTDLINELNRRAKNNWEIRFHTKDGKQLYDINYPDSPVTPDYEDYTDLLDALSEVMADIY